VRFLNALTAGGTDTLKVFAFVGRDASNAKEIIQPLITHTEKNPKTLNAFCARTNYKGCMVYKDLRRNFFTTLRRKVVISELQTRTEPTNIQIRHIQLGRSYASVARTDNKQQKQTGNTRKNNFLKFETIYNKHYTGITKDDEGIYKNGKKWAQCLTV